MNVDLSPSHTFARNFHPETKTEGENVATAGVAEDSMDPAIPGLWMGSVELYMLNIVWSLLMNPTVQTTCNFILGDCHNKHGGRVGCVGGVVCGGIVT